MIFDLVQSVVVCLDSLDGFEGFNWLLLKRLIIRARDVNSNRKLSYAHHKGKQKEAKDKRQTKGLCGFSQLEN